MKQVMLSGGETLCYPYLYEIIKAASQYCGRTVIALSGYGLTREVFEKLVEAGVSDIAVSLNGSTDEINSLTRSGYNYAISALELLSENNYQNTTINWVMHSSNADDFENIIKIAEQYRAAKIEIIGLKPDSNKELISLPSKNQMIEIKNIILNYKGDVEICVEPCFSPMLALLCDTKLFGNLNRGEYKGCIAGRTTFCVNIDRSLSPCRHLNYRENFDTLKEYLDNSQVQNLIRQAELNKKEPCRSCRFTDNCRHCLAINAKLNGEIYIGNALCSIYSSNII